MRSITDGEFRREAWHYDFLCGLDGIEQTAPHQGPTFKGGQGVASLEIVAPIRNPNGVMLDHFRFLRDRVSETPKFCIPSPSLAYHRSGRALIDRDVYPDLEAFREDLYAAYRDEVRMLHDAGCRYLQLDDTTFAMLCDPKVRYQMNGRGDDPAELIRIYARGIAEALKDRPDDMTVTVHMCRGNFRSSWIAEGGYEPVAEDMFGGVPVDGFFMEWDTGPGRRVRAAPLRAAREDGGAGAGQLQVSRAGVEGRSQAPRRRGRPLPAHGKSMSQPAMRLRQHGRRQRGQRAGPVGQARPGGRDGGRDLGRRVRRSGRGQGNDVREVDGFPGPGRCHRHAAGSSRTPGYCRRTSQAAWPCRLKATFHL